MKTKSNFFLLWRKTIAFAAFLFLIFNITYSQISNVALNKPVVADSERDIWVAANAVDGNNSDGNSRWLSGDGAPYPYWIEIDLQDNYNITQVKFWNGYSGWDRPVKNYKFQYWDGSNWIDIIDVSGNLDAAVSHSFPQVTTDKVRLYITSVDGNIVRLYEIEVYGSSVGVPVTGVSVDPSGLTLNKGQTSDLDETISPINATNKTVHWSSNNNAVATVDANGLVTAVMPGSAVIKATTDDGGYFDECTITVNCPILAVPSGVSTTQGSNEVTVSWNTVNGADGYKVSYSQIPGQAINGTVEIVNGGSSTIKTISGLTNGVTYYFVVAAIYSICESNASGEVPATPSSHISEYTGQNIYISTISSGKNLGNGINATRIEGKPDGFNGTLVPLNFLIDISAPNAESNLDACLTFSYSDIELPEGVNFNTLDLYKYNENTGKWMKMGGTLDSERNEIKLCSIDEFSKWTIAGSAPESVPLQNWGVFIAFACVIVVGLKYAKK